METTTNRPLASDQSALQAKYHYMVCSTLQLCASIPELHDYTYEKNATHVVAPQNRNVVFESMVVSHISMVASDGSSLKPQANHLVNDHSQQSGTWSTASLLCFMFF